MAFEPIDVPLDLNTRPVPQPPKTEAQRRADDAAELDRIIARGPWIHRTRVEVRSFRAISPGDTEAGDLATAYIQKLEAAGAAVRVTHLAPQPGRLHVALEITEPA